LGKKYAHIFRSVLSTEPLGFPGNPEKTQIRDDTPLCDDRKPEKQTADDRIKKGL
jgi:hypothetical protein